MIVRRLSIFLLPLVQLACVSDPENTGNPPLDGGGPPRDAGATDASVRDGTVPAPASDAEVSDAPVDTGPLPVTVTVVNAHGLLSGVTVVFGDATGAVLATATTAANGTVSQLVPSGSQVTAVLGTALTPELVTVLGVEPGDTLTARAFGAQRGEEIAVSVDGLPPNPPAGTESYRAHVGSCETSFVAPPAQYYVGWECLAGSTFPLLVTARNANFATLGFTFKKLNSTIVDAGLPDTSFLGVSPTLAWSTAQATYGISIANPVPDRFGTAYYSEVAEGVPMWTSQTISPDEADAGADAAAQVHEFSGHPGYPDFVQAEARMRRGITAGVSFTAIATRGAPPATAGGTTIDMSTLLPELTSATLDRTAPARPTTTWTTAAPLGASDGTIVHVHWFAPTDGDVGIRGSWTFVAPPTATSVRAPELPASAAAWAPTAAASFHSPPIVVVVDGTFWSGYPQLRSTFAAVPPTKALVEDRNGPTVPPLPVDGTLRLTAFTRSGD